MADARTHALKESLLAELLSDVDKLLERGEALHVGFGEHLASVHRTVGDVSRAEASRFQDTVSGERERWQKEARAITRQLFTLSNDLAVSGKYALWNVMLAGTLGGALGGLMVALATGFL